MKGRDIMSRKGSSLLETRRRNRALIKDIIFRMQPVTRIRIAQELGLTLPTITTSVNEMIYEGILEEVPFFDEKLANTAGRKPVAIKFRDSAIYVIGIELGPYATTVVLMNIKGDILGKKVAQIANETYCIMLEELSKLIQDIVHEFPQNIPIGVGIGVPGFIDRQKGRIKKNKRKDWIDKHFAQDLEDKISLPVIIDNNVRLRAVGYEMRYGGIRPTTFAYFFISKGIACPIMIKDDEMAGYTSGAGEVGHMILLENAQEEKSIEELSGEKALLDQCKRLVEEGRAEILEEIVKNDGEFTMKQVLLAQLNGDLAVQNIMNQGMKYLGIALSNIVNLINPEFVVVDGYVMKNEQNQLLFREVAKSRFFGIDDEDVTLIFEPFDQFRGAQGAGYFVIRQLFLEK